MLTLIFLFKLGYQAEKAQSRWGCIRELQSNLRSGKNKKLFFLHRNLGVLLILFITFKAIDYLERVSFNKQLR